MKTINTLVFTNPDTDVTIFNEVANAQKGFVFSFSSDIENVLEASYANYFNMIIIDAALETETKIKLNKIIDLTNPNIATLALYMNDSDFIQYKLNEMQGKWIEAHSDFQFRFSDNPIDNIAF